ncbi:MAG: hypothetical protein IPI10_18220 [Bacteroidetes bacterium]|nr:hypothetical protein [Bacteroidota bacterium]
MKVITTIFSRFCIPFILLISIWLSVNLKWGENQRKYVIISDGKGYYAYLPAAFIYHDMNMMFFDSIEAKYYDANTKYQYRTVANGKVIDKYFAGAAVMQVPFFLTAHAITLMSDEPADGYSKWYVIFCLHWRNILARSRIMLLEEISPASRCERRLFSRNSVSDFFRNQPTLLFVGRTNHVAPVFVRAGQHVSLLRKKVDQQR